MAEFKLERFKYNWRGDWRNSVSYKRDDIVRVNGKSYVCVVTHTSSALFVTDLLATLPGSVPPQPQPKWKVMTSGKEFVGEYQPSTVYNLGDIVLYDGTLLTCTVSHTATGAPSEITNWEVFASGISFKGEWETGTVYGPGAVVKYNGIVYKSLTAHLSSATLEADAVHWETFNNGVEYVSTWQTETGYRKNDLVKYGGTIFRCVETHTSTGVEIDDSKFVVDIFGSQFDGEWTSNRYYNIGDIVTHLGYMYYAVTNNGGSRPFTNASSDDWILLAKSYSFAGNWTVTGIYRTGDVVLRGGNLYQALQDIGNGAADGSSTDYLDDTIWELLVPGKTWKGLWQLGQKYSLGDVVYYLGTSYKCTFEHIAAQQNFPGDNGNVYNYWDIVFEGIRPAGLKVAGDLVTYGLSRDLAGVQDTSTLGPVRVPIGETEQLLSVTADLELYWRNLTPEVDRVYVTPNGTDDIGYGSFEKPFRTIKYAADYVEDTFAPGTPVIITVSVGKFEEIAPIIVPAGCAINGDELRSTIVKANEAFPDYARDYPYLSIYLNYFTSIITNVVTGTPITPRPGNTSTQATVANTINFPVGNAAGVSQAINLITDYVNFIAFRVANGTVNPAVSGSNVLNPDIDARNVALALELNKQFIRDDMLAFLRNAYPLETLNYVNISNDIWALLRGLIRDIKYSGNSATLTAAQRFANGYNGSQLGNLFLMRDSTGLRDLTTQGLRGALNPPGVFDLYQLPTGGACVALDPGWGPDDDRVWITNRSPYVQGVTNTGTGCTGMKIDGSLHNGGNKSMVSNDFTQVLSDGIGVWVSNNARAELVSVFTYYCQIGYFAEDGGIIRAANGNNSYGRYGSIADGQDSTEVPQNATVFNRNNQAQIAEAFAGGATDELFVFEYLNAGEEYTFADAAIIGAGANADIEYTDFRDGGLFEARLTSPDGSSAKGGSGYLIRQGAAQETLSSASTVRLSSNEVTQFLSEIEGMRIVITDGKGAGQYGYITNFDFVTKAVTVARDSDDQPGWDHYIPGTPIESSLDLTTRYKIEPRIKSTSPTYSTDDYDLFTNRVYVDADFNGFTETFTGLSNQSTALWEDDTSISVKFGEVISPIAITLSGRLQILPDTPLTIRGRTSDTEVTITTFTANTGSALEADITGDPTGFITGEELTLIYTSGSGETFDTAPVPAVFSVVREGKAYDVTLTNPGAGYSVGDTIVIEGTRLGGATPANDLTIAITEVSDDSSSSIQAFTIIGTGREGRFVALTDSIYSRYSDNGIIWNEVNLAFSGDYRKLVSGDNRFIALANNQNRISYSLTGESWSEVALPLTASWRDGVYGGGKFVLVADDTDLVAVSSNGTTWTTSSIPDDTDGAPDSTESQWTHVVYGKGKYLAVSQNDYATATSSDGVTWTRHDSVLPDLSPDPDWDIVSVTYGNNRFMLLDSTGRNAYSFDGITWYNGQTIDDGADFTPREVKYSQGIFLVIGRTSGTSASDVCATSEDGLLWTIRDMPSSKLWSALAYGKINGTSKWVALATAASTGGIAHIGTGATAKLRVNVNQGVIDDIRIIDPGGNYSDDNLPILTITDPNALTEASYESRIGNGVLAQPDFINRGAGYRRTTSVINITGDGYADIIPEGNSITLSGIENIPGPGVQIRIAGILDETTVAVDDLKVFSGVEVFDLGDDGTGNGTRLIRLTVTPRIRTENNVIHGAAVTLREKFSQCRVSGHDFLDIGTGNFEETNYPELYAGGAFFTASPENEVYEANGGRVFYVSTDQDGNFRTGELFSVQQSTGVVTISAQFFDLDGLSELSLGGVRLGGSGTIINEFSTDGTFSADSNNVIPTQRAIVSFLADRLSVGGENLEVNRLQAGRIAMGGVDNSIDNSADQYLYIGGANGLSRVVFDGTFESVDDAGVITVEQTAISGTIISQMLFAKQFDDTMQ